MELELGSAIVGAVSIALVALPVVLIGSSKRKKEKHFKVLLSEFAAKHDCKLDFHEISGNLAIGMDTSRNFVFFCAETNEQVNEQIVDLGKIQNCKVIKTSSMVRNKEGNQQVIDRLELSFIPMAKAQPEIRLEFFNADVNLQLYGELQAAEKWSKLINGRLKGKG
ncbi:MAG: hypothetical protein WD578_02475 [Bacteroidales bacterium]